MSNVFIPLLALIASATDNELAKYAKDIPKESDLPGLEYATVKLPKINES